MVRDHLPRLAMPKSWPIKRKGIKWVTKPLSAHKMEMCIPLSIAIRDLLGYSKTAKETRKILNSGDAMVNKAVRKDPKFGVGFMDVVEFPKVNEAYRMLLNSRGRLELHKITAEEANLLPAKIIGKRMIKGSKAQLNLSGGVNMLVSEGSYKVGDTLVLDADSYKVKEHLPMEKGATVYITAGNRVSMSGKLESIKPFKGIHPDNIVFTANDKSYETRKEYAFVVGKGKPVISLP